MALGMLVKGKWITERNDPDQNGKSHKKPTTFRDRITIDGSSGFKAEAIISMFPWLVRGRIEP